MESLPVSMPAQPGDHPLQRKFCFWYMQRPTGRNVVAAEDYEKSIKPIGEFETVEGFWNIYNHLKRPNDIPATTELHLFRSGIKPIWEDKGNQQGGKLIVRLTKGLSSRFWELVLLAVIGEQFDAGDEICGVVLSIRPHEDILAIWNRSADNQVVIGRIRENLKSILDLPAFVRTEYKRHEKRLRNARPGAPVNPAAPAPATQWSQPHSGGRFGDHLRDKPEGQMWS